MFLQPLYSVKIVADCYLHRAQSDPYPGMDPLEAAFAVRDGYRMTLPDETPPALAVLVYRYSSNHSHQFTFTHSCWATDPAERPDFMEIFNKLKQINSTIEAKDDERGTESPAEYLKTPVVIYATSPDDVNKGDYATTATSSEGVYQRTK